ncbi:uncharacterized protein C17orf53 homolog isoform X3 [Strigops habroptila]|uniref:uncharacterized protein C17orf53 homolog isoform X3 n=1 Tax=Strigops habroptila TaxID=2489341 RepID=UPI0011CF425F|nr:uncharacterized protein C17orf53 homolog isoform X3 [Strigops habroptila]
MDFLSAVEDAENQFVVSGHGRGAPGAPPLQPGHGPGPRPALRPLPGGCRSPPAPQDEPDNDLLLAACVELEGSGLWEQPPQERETPNKPRVGAGPDLPPAPQAAPRLVLRPSAAGACSAATPTPVGKPWSSIPAPRAPSLTPFQAPPHRPGASGSSLEPQVLRPPPAQPPRQPPRVPPSPAVLQTPVVTNHLVQLVTAANKAPGAAPRPPAQGKTRRFPGPAGILPQQHGGKLLEEILISAPQTPSHGAMAKPRTEGLPSSSLPSEEDFGKGPWLAMKTELELDERDPGCFLRTYSVVMVLRKAALKQLPKNKVPSMAVMIKTLTRTNVDAGAVFRDPTGEMQGTVHRLLLEERQSELRPGSVLLLRWVSSPHLTATTTSTSPPTTCSRSTHQRPRAASRSHHQHSRRTLLGPGSSQRTPWSPPRVSLPLGTGGDTRGPAATAQSRRLGKRSQRELKAVTWMTWMGSWGSCRRISSPLRPKLTAADARGCAGAWAVPW